MKKGQKMPERLKRNLSKKITQQYLNGRIPSFINKHHSKTTKKKLREFRLGKKHSEKTKQLMSKERQLDKNANWKGGLKLQHNYVLVKIPSHPFANSQGYVKRSRLILEKKLGRYLLKNEVCHHKNGNKQDDRPENLKLISSRAKHSLIHYSERKLVNGHFTK